MSSKSKTNFLVFQVLFIVFLIAILATVLFSLTFYGDKWKDVYFNINGGEFFVALGTIILAYATAYFAYQSSVDATESRKTLVDENIKSRKKEYLLKKLEFYSNIKGDLIDFKRLEDIKDPDITKTDLDSIVRSLKSLLNRTPATQKMFEFLCEPDTKKSFNTFYEFYFGDFQNLSGLENEKFQLTRKTTYEIIDKLIKNINEDFEKLSNDYMSP
jgi:hypothetical protein